MIVAIPTVDGKLCMHFGHCAQFALVEVNVDSKKIWSTKYITPPPHEPGLLPAWLQEQGANMIVAGGMGQRAKDLLAENGIQVVVGATGGTPDEIVNAYLCDTLQVGENACDH